MAFGSIGDNRGIGGRILSRLLEVEQRVRESVNARGCEVPGARIERLDDGAERAGHRRFRVAATPNAIMRAWPIAQMSIFTLPLGAVGSISPIVGGITTTNIMLANVTERRAEIAIRRTLGSGTQGARSSSKPSSRP